MLNIANLGPLHPDFNRCAVYSAHSTLTYKILTKWSNPCHWNIRKLAGQPHLGCHEISEGPQCPST